MNKKHNIEKDHFIALRRLMGLFPEGDVIHLDNPDFLIDSPNGIIGVEHMQVFIDKGNTKQVALQEKESNIQDVLLMAQEMAELRDIPPLDVNIVFNDLTNFDKKYKLNHARKILSIVINRISTNPSSQTILLDWEDNRELLDFGLTMIRIFRLPRNDNHHWHNAEAGWALTKCVELLQNYINQKNSKYAEFIKKCDLCWLLLVAESKPSSFIHPDETSLNNLYKSSFDKIYFINMSMSQLYELKIFPSNNRLKPTPA